MVSLSRAGRQPLPESSERALAGIAMALGSMLLFSIGDGFTKSLAMEYDPFEVSALRYFCTALLLAPFVLRRGVGAMRTAVPLLQFGRGLAMLGSSIFFISGLTSLPLADATTIGFASPLMVTALSIPLLGEKVGARRWSAVFVGFVGVVIVVRPGGSTFNPAAIYPLLSAVAWAFGLIATRKMRNADPVLTTMLYSTLVGLTLAPIALPFIWQTPSLEACGLLLGAASVFALGQYFTVRAFALAPASLLAPFAYSQILWSTLIGYFAFATIPDAMTWLGAAIIVASGLYTLHRERIVARERRMDN
jgi:drug/metabolite transporter (DMT)-like permease